MGNENITKDSNIQIFLELKSLIFKSGQKLKGCIYLEAKQYSSYSDLFIKLQCYQKTQNKNIKDKYQEYLTQEKKTYIDQKPIAQFMNGLYKGQYKFPFNFQLPKQLPGSLILGTSNYIRYRLTAFIQSSSPQITNQLHERQIWVVQNFRGSIQPISNRQVQQAKCCMWGYSYGNVQTLVECQSNNFQAGQKIKLKFQINAKRLNTYVKKTCIRFLEKNVIITQNQVQQKEMVELFTFDFNQIIIQKGGVKKMEKNIQLPVDMYPTSIGQLISRFYVVEVRLIFSCFSQLTQYIHVFINSNKNGLEEQNKPFVKSKNWKPVKYKKLELKEMRKYEYKGHQKMPVNNKARQNPLEIMKIIEQSKSNRRLTI